METSTGIARDHLADMTRERDAWRNNAYRLLLYCFANMAMWMGPWLAPHIERAWLAWRAEPVPQVRAQVQCMDPVRVLEPTGGQSVWVPHE